MPHVGLLGNTACSASCSVSCIASCSTPHEHVKRLLYTINNDDDNNEDANVCQPELEMYAACLSSPGRLLPSNMIRAQDVHSVKVRQNTVTSDSPGLANMM